MAPRLLSYYCSNPYRAYWSHLCRDWSCSSRKMGLGRLNKWGAMPMSDDTLCYGIKCKNGNCGVMIALGRYEGEITANSRRITFYFLKPTLYSCPKCRREYEYTQSDLVSFPCPEGGPDAIP